MNIIELKEEWNGVFKNIQNGNFTCEGHIVDYKLNLNELPKTVKPEEAILYSLGKDIISFANADGCILIIGIEENKQNNNFELKGVNEYTLNCFKGLSIDELKKKIQSYTKYSLAFEKDIKQIGNYSLCSLIVSKAEDVLVIEKDFTLEDKPIFKKGEVYFRDGDGNETANHSTSKMNKFIQKKANEKSKDFMTIWSKLLPEMIDINPREVLILNVEEQKIYGFNKNGSTLTGGKILIDERENTFKIILEAIQAGEIGKISTDEGKPIYRIVGDIAMKGDPITTCVKKVKESTNYKLSTPEYKKVLVYLEYINEESITVTKRQSEMTDITEKGREYIFSICTNETHQRYDLRFTQECTQKVIQVIKDENLHNQLFGKPLNKTK